MVVHRHGRPEVLFYEDIVLSRIHMDGIVLASTLEVDGVTRLEEGRLLVDIEGE